MPLVGLASGRQLQEQLCIQSHRTEGRQAELAPHGALFEVQLTYADGTDLVSLVACPA